MLKWLVTHAQVIVKWLVTHAQVSLINAHNEVVLKTYTTFLCLIYLLIIPRKYAQNNARHEVVPVSLCSYLPSCWVTPWVI